MKIESVEEAGYLEEELNYKGRRKKVCTFRVCGISYNVYECDSPTLGDRAVAGLIDYKPNVIYVDREAPEDDQRGTLLHEVLHAVDSEFYVGMDEEQITRMAAGLFDTLTNNPTLRKRIFDA